MSFERILAVKREQLLATLDYLPIRDGEFKTFYFDHEVLKKVLSNDIMVVTRPDCETDKDYVQLIPYIHVAITENDKEKIFTYARGASGGESRLHAKYSCGLGGHVSYTGLGAKENFRLTNTKYTIYDILTDQTIKELKEEVGLVNSQYYENSIKDKLLHNATCFYNLDDNVDQYHLCINITINVGDKENLSKLEDNVITKPFFATKEELLLKHEKKELELESWSHILVNNSVPY